MADSHKSHIDVMFPVEGYSAEYRFGMAVDGKVLWRQDLATLAEVEFHSAMFFFDSIEDARRQALDLLRQLDMVDRNTGMVN